MLGDGGGAADRSRSRSGRFREVTKGSRSDLSHDGNESDRELHLDGWVVYKECEVGVAV